MKRENWEKYLPSASVLHPIMVCVSPEDELERFQMKSIHSNLILAAVIASLPKGKKYD